MAGTGRSSFVAVVESVAVAFAVVVAVAVSPTWRQTNIDVPASLWLQRRQTRWYSFDHVCKRKSTERLIQCLKPTSELCTRQRLTLNSRHEELHCLGKSKEYSN